MSIIDAFSTEEKEEVKLAGQVLNKAGLTIMNAESKSTPPIVDQIIQKGPKTFSDISFLKYKGTSCIARVPKRIICIMFAAYNLGVKLFLRRKILSQ